MIWVRRLLLPLLLLGPQMWILLRATNAQIDQQSLWFLGSSFYALDAFLVALFLIGAAVRSPVSGLLPQALAAAGYGAVTAFHLRETTGFPTSTTGLAISAVLIALLTLLVLRVLGGRPAAKTAAASRADHSRPKARLGWRWALVTLLIAPAVVLFAYARGGQVRWHLLQHAKVLGSPLEAAFGTPPSVIEAREVDERALAGAEAARAIRSRFGPPATPFNINVPSPQRSLPLASTPVAPSIVFLLIDTLRADALSAWGGERQAMPRLDESLEHCQRFTDVLANSSWTRPSIASMHTGLLPEHHGARGVAEPLEAAHLTFIEVLRDAGYDTAALVTNPTAGGISGLDQGFDTFVEIDREPYARAEILNRAALEFLDLRKAEARDRKLGPLFLYLHYLDPHEPYLAGVKPGWSRDSYLRAYDSELSYLDDQLFEVLPEIRQRLGADVLFFLISDHGEEFFEHDLFGHGHSLYDEVVRIPAALCGGPFEGGEVETRLEGRDVFSLMVSVANGSLRSNTDLRVWARAHGRTTRSLSLSFQGFGRLALRPYLVSLYQRAFETKDGKWIWNAYGDTWEHYAPSDPLELNNLAAGDLEAATEKLNEQTPAPWYRAQPFTADDVARARLNKIGYVQ